MSASSICYLWWQLSWPQRWAAHGEECDTKLCPNLCKIWSTPSHGYNCYGDLYSWPCTLHLLLWWQKKIGIRKAAHTSSITWLEPGGECHELPFGRAHRAGWVLWITALNGRNISTPSDWNPWKIRAPNPMERLLYTVNYTRQWSSIFLYYGSSKSHKVLFKVWQFIPLPPSCIVLIQE